MILILIDHDRSKATSRRLKRWQLGANGKLPKTVLLDKENRREERFMKQTWEDKERDTQKHEAPSASKTCMGL